MSATNIKVDGNKCRIKFLIKIWKHGQFSFLKVKYLEGEASSMHAALKFEKQIICFTHMYQKKS